MNENGLRGRSGERGLSAFAKRSSPDSALAVRVMVLIEFIEAKPPAPLVCWASWTDSGGCRATVRRESGPAGLVFELGVGVGLVTGVGIECDA